MRDALSLLDQLIAFGGGKVDEASARGMLGTIDRDHVDEARARARRRRCGASCWRRRARSKSSRRITARCWTTSRRCCTRVALLQLVPGYEGDELFDPALLDGARGAISAEDVQLYYQTAILGRRDLRLRARSAHRFRDDAGAHAGVPSGGRRGDVPERRRAAARGASVRHRCRPACRRHAIVRPASAGPIDPVQWARVIGDLDVTGAARQLATNCALIEHRGDTLRLGARRARSRARRPAGRTARAGAGEVSRRAREARVRRRRAAGRNAGADTANAARRKRSTPRANRSRKIPTVREMKSRFGATLHPESVRPTE